VNSKQVVTLEVEQVEKIYVPTVTVGTIRLIKLSLSLSIYIRVVGLRGTR
jgi:hypothetical protein